MFKNIFSLKGILYIFLISVYIWIGYKLWLFDSAGNGFILGDWLVNYQDGGFKRRGLSGSLFFWLQDLTGISLTVLVYATQMGLYLFFFITLFKFLRKKNISLLFFTLMISPLTFLIYFNDAAMVGRKEILFLNIFAYYLYLISKNKITVKKEYFIYILLIIATFLHEITIFYVPYFALAHYLIYKKIDIKKYLLFFLSCFIPAVIIFVLGAKTNEGNSLELLAQRGVILEPHSIFSFTNDLYVQMDKYKADVLRYFLYLPSLLIGMLHFGIYMYKETDVNYKRCLSYFACLIVYSFPLFFLACDWGRWIHIHFVLLLLILIFKLPNINEGLNFTKSKSIVPFFRRNFQYSLIILFLLVWTVQHYGNGLTYNGFFSAFIFDLAEFIYILEK